MKPYSAAAETNSFWTSVLPNIYQKRTND